MFIGKSLEIKHLSFYTTKRRKKEKSYEFAELRTSLSRLRVPVAPSAGLSGLA